LQIQQNLAQSNFLNQMFYATFIGVQCAIAPSAAGTQRTAWQQAVAGQSGSFRSL
jgi:hypothetical protein